MDKEYIQSGRFIHDELVRRCEVLPDRVRQLFRKDRYVHPTLLIWPADTIRTKSGGQFSGVVFSELSADAETRRQEVKDSILRTAAWAALVTEQLPDAVRLLFESGQGTRTWRLPIKNHGDVQVLGPTEARDNVESLGVLWVAN